MGRTALACRDRIALGSQVAGALALFVVFAAAPPARGAILLMPIDAHVPVARLAFASGAAVLGTGPAGSMVVRGERNALFWPMLRAGVLILAAPATLCGGAVR